MTTRLIKPVITEKSMRLAQAGQFTFIVSLAATKNTIKQAAEDLFKVNVIKVRVIKRAGRIRRTGKKRLPGHQPGRKKAIVTLKAGEIIKYFELPKEKSKKTKKKKK